MFGPPFNPVTSRTCPFRFSCPVVVSSPAPPASRSRRRARDGRQVRLPARLRSTELMAPNALPDVVEGEANAPVTIVEYASMTCSHCAAFHHDVYPALKKNYVDTGKAKFILREFPLDPLATAAFMLARELGRQARRGRRSSVRAAEELGLRRQAARRPGQCPEAGWSRSGEVRGRL